MPRPRTLRPFEDRLLAGLFALYRLTLSPVLASTGLGQCLYRPTCSEYAYVAVARHGWLRGSAMALRRLARCHPWAAGGLDLVPPDLNPAPPRDRADHLP